MTRTRTTINDAWRAGCRSGADVRAIRALSDGEACKCHRMEWTRDDSLELDGRTVGGWLVNGVTPIYDPQVPVV